MASSVSERRDRAHLSCATIPLVTPGSYRRGRLLLWVFGVVDLPSRLPHQLLLVLDLSRVCRGFFFSRLVGISPSVLVVLRVFFFLMVSAGSFGNPCGFRCTGSPSFFVFLEFFVIVGLSELSFYFLAFFIPICGLLAGLVFWPFYGISELRGARQVERFAQCSVRHWGK